LDDDRADRQLLVDVRRVLWKPLLRVRGLPRAGGRVPRRQLFIIALIVLAVGRAGGGMAWRQGALVRVGGGMARRQSALVAVGGGMAWRQSAVLLRKRGARTGVASG